MYKNCCTSRIDVVQPALKDQKLYRYNRFYPDILEYKHYRLSRIRICLSLRVIFESLGSIKLYREGSLRVPVETSSRDWCIENPVSLNVYWGPMQNVIDLGHSHFECLIEASSRKQMYREAKWTQNIITKKTSRYIWSSTIASLQPLEVTL